MEQLVKIKGIKGKQNKKKWAKNIDVSALLQAAAEDHNQKIKAKFQSSIQVSDDYAKRLPLDPNRFKNKTTNIVKKVYNNSLKRNIDIQVNEDPWKITNNTKNIYQKSQIPAVILPQSGHSYRPREEDKQALIDRVIDYEMNRPNPRKLKNDSQLPVVQVRHRNKKKRAAQLEARARKEYKQFRQQLHNIKKIKNQIQEKQKLIENKIKTKIIAKQKEKKEWQSGRVRKGPKLGKIVYRFKQSIPTSENVQKVSKLALSDDLIQDRFDSIFRRGALQPRNIKVHANKKKHIKVKQRQ